MTTDKTVTAQNCNLTAREMLESITAGAVFLILSVLNGLGLYYLVIGMAP